MTPPPKTKISHLSWIAKGAQRLVLLHPDKPGLVLKVSYVGSSKERSLAAISTAEKALNRHLIRERKIYKSLGPTFGGDLDNLPIPYYYGIIETDIGFADVYEGILRENSSKLGMTFGQIMRGKLLTPKILSDLNKFVTLLDRFEIPATDINAANIVYGYRDNRLIFVLVDGFGDYRKIPFETWFRVIRRKRTSVGFRKIAKKYDLIWDDETRQFQV